MNPGFSSHLLFYQVIRLQVFSSHHPFTIRSHDSGFSSKSCSTRSHDSTVQ
uniref:Uncharacterized protein n=1 Tax=Anguilla anguilla TaxID=7936 RepID=A0A0E9T935_ANGAN